MNRKFVLLLAFLGWLPTAGAQSVEEQYVRIYNLIQQADALSKSGDDQSALPKYLEASTSLQQLQKVYPSWNPKVVGFRLNYLGEKIVAIPQVRSAPVAGTPEKAGAPTGPAAISVSDTSGELKQQLVALQESVRQLQSEKTILESKLKEALATQPATIDPRELNKAQERVQSLLKENELLKTGLEAERSRPSALNAKELDDTRRQLAETNTRLVEQRAANEKLTSEKSGLQEQLSRATSSAETAGALRAENDLLKQQLALAKANAGNAAATADTAQRLTEAEAQIATMRSDAQVLRLEKIALESRLKKALEAPVAKSGNVARPEDEQRIRQLERERDDYAQKLAQANKQSQGARSRELDAKVQELTREVASLKSKVEVFEARAIPYAAEELALFQPSPPQPLPVGGAGPAARPANEKPSIKEMPAGTVALVASAEKHFAAKEYSQAEADYLNILRQDENNAYTLANLGAIQLELGRLEEAEKHIQQALAISPDDAHAVSLLGYLKFRQEKYDEAITALNRAAKLSPQDAEVQNYLGVTLTRKGLRGPAEQAFRRAVVLNPNHAGAHNNLAVFYASETPPNVPLARFHYQKALAAGHPRNPEVEALFEKKAAAVKATTP